MKGLQERRACDRKLMDSSAYETFTKPGLHGEISLIGSCCRDCGTRFFPQHASCINCFGHHLDSIELERVGKVNRFTIVRQAPTGYFGPVPYVIGNVILDDGVSVVSQLIGKNAEDWQRGDIVAAYALELPSGDGDAPTVQCYGFGPLL